MTAPLPPNEAQRLRALRDYDILDSPPEVAFERLVGLATQLFDVPIAIVSFIDSERQWFKACFGMDRRQTKRELSFCAYAILGSEVMVVPDATLDERFRDNSMVVGPPNVRFYAGAPLRTSEGYNLGSICVVDMVPRKFDEAQKGQLADLADIVVDELELRRTARNLRVRENELMKAARESNRLNTAISTLNSGVLMTDPLLPDNPIIFANAGFYAMTGYTPEEVLGRNCRFLQGPGTDQTQLNVLREAIAQHRPCQAFLLNYRKDGRPFVNDLSVAPVFDGAGNLINFVGLQHDITDKENARQILEQRVVERTADLANSQVEILQRLARASEYRDDETGQHTQRVARTAALLARQLGWSDEKVSQIQQAAPLHDVGKIAVSDLILLKSGKLTPEEFGTMQTHTSIGASMLSNGQSEVVKMAERIAGTHHERWDGSGYPAGLAGEAIPIEGRILAVADVFDALTHERPYKWAWPLDEALEEIKAQSGKQFDPQIVEAFLNLDHEKLI